MKRQGKILLDNVSGKQLRRLPGIRIPESDTDMAGRRKSPTVAIKAHAVDVVVVALQDSRTLTMIFAT
jgi:hypothetical protein